MLNYEEFATQANDHRTLRLAQAEQRRLVQALAAPHANPVIMWVGRLVSRWGRPAAPQKSLLMLPTRHDKQVDPTFATFLA